MEPQSQVSLLLALLLPYLAHNSRTTPIQLSSRFPLQSPATYRQRQQSNLFRLRKRLRRLLQALMEQEEEQTDGYRQ